MAHQIYTFKADGLSEYIKKFNTYPSGVIPVAVKYFRSSRSAFNGFGDAFHEAGNVDYTETQEVLFEFRVFYLSELIVYHLSKEDETSMLDKMTFILDLVVMEYFLCERLTKKTRAFLRLCKKGIARLDEYAKYADNVETQLMLFWQAILRAQTSKLREEGDPIILGDFHEEFIFRAACASHIEAFHKYLKASSED